MRLKKPVLFTLAFSPIFYLSPALGADSSADLKERSQETFRKGKNLYDQGRYSEAFREWDAVLSSLEGQSVKKTIAFLKSRVKDVVIEPMPAAQSTGPAVTAPWAEGVPVPSGPEAPAAVAPKEEQPRVRSPEGLQETLDEAENKIKEESRAAARDAVRFREEKERTLQIQKELDTSFENGKKAFEKGKIDQAAAEWEKILPHFEDAAGFRHRLESLRRGQRHLASLRALNLRTQKKGASAPQAPGISERLRKLLEDSNAGLVARAKEEMKSRQARLLEAQKRSEEVIRLEKDFESGKDFLSKGDYERAAEAWEEALPSPESRQELKEKLSELSENRRRVKEISRLLVMKEAETPLEPALREKEMDALLQNASLRLSDEVKELQAKRSAKEGLKAGAKDRQADIEKTFQKGKALYSKGQVAEAAEVWAKIAPTLQNRRLIEDLIRDVRFHSDRIHRLRAEPLKAAATSDTRLRQVEIEMGALLRQARAKHEEGPAPGPLENHQFYLEKKLPTPAARRKEVKRREALESAEAAERKQAWVRSTFEKGKAMIESGHSREAFQLWGALTPYLAKEPEIKTYIKKASAAARVSSGRV